MLTMPMRTDLLILDPFEAILLTIFPLCMTLVYVLPILRMTSRLVKEKVRNFHGYACCRQTGSRIT
jgi:hypothetical protein